MNAAIAALGALVLYALGYRFYSRYLSQRVFQLDPARRTPAHSEQDGIDYVPTRPAILFGHHFASITGLAPMLGPAVAVIWGWLPALLWVVGGALLIGCVHDFSALVLSVRSRGQSIGKVAEHLIGPRACTLFHLIIFFGVSLAMGVFVLVIATLFSTEIDDRHPGYPQAVLPSGALMLIAGVAGFLLYRRNFRLAPVATVGFLLLLGSIWLGNRYPTMGLDASSWPAAQTWIFVLLSYGFVASILPVWALLQSRDFLNSLLLYLGLGLAYLGLFVGAPEFHADAVRMNPPGAPPMFPFVFIVIACGAASGFHGLVSSGTTAKQLDRETHARPIAYGGMIGESLLGLLATLACTAGLSSVRIQHDYESWGAMTSLAAKVAAFIDGSTTFLSHLNFAEDLGRALVATFVVSFALTTLDSATRLLRFNVEEIAQTFRIPLPGGRYTSSLLACAAIAFFAMYKIGTAPAGKALWQLFGTTNQLLAGLTLLTVTVYLIERKKNYWITAIPMVFMLVSTFIAMTYKLRDFSNNWTFDRLEPLFLVGAALMALGLWLIIEATLALRRAFKRASADRSMILEESPPTS